MVETLVVKTMRAVERSGSRFLCLGGGVACNRELRETLAVECERLGVSLRIPSPRLCADNAAMIALVGAWRLEAGAPGEPKLDAAASLEETSLAGG